MKRHALHLFTGREEEGSLTLSLISLSLAGGGGPLSFTLSFSALWRRRHGKYSLSLYSLCLGVYTAGRKEVASLILCLKGSFSLSHQLPISLKTSVSLSLSHGTLLSTEGLTHSPLWAGRRLLSLGLTANSFSLPPALSFSLEDSTRSLEQNLSKEGGSSTEGGMLEGRRQAGKSLWAWPLVLCLWEASLFSLSGESSLSPAHLSPLSWREERTRRKSSLSLTSLSRLTSPLPLQKKIGAGRARCAGTGGRAGARGHTARRARGSCSLCSGRKKKTLKKTRHAWSSLSTSLWHSLCSLLPLSLEEREEISPSHSLLPPLLLSLGSLWTGQGISILCTLWGGSPLCSLVAKGITNAGLISRSGKGPLCLSLSPLTLSLCLGHLSLSLSLSLTSFSAPQAFSSLITIYTLYKCSLSCYHIISAEGLTVSLWGAGGATRWQGSTAAGAATRRALLPLCPRGNGRDDALRRVRTTQGVERGAAARNGGWCGPL